MRIMSNTKLVLEGLDEFREALRKLPNDMAREAGVIVLAQAELAQAQIQRAYPERRGRLRGGVTVNREGDSRFGASAIVRSRAPHAWLYEHGSTPRQNRKGANRGAMPQAPEANRFGPIAGFRRRAMVAALTDLVRRAGFAVDA
jgi:hypothetical protein